VLEATSTTSDLLAPNNRLIRVGSGLGGTSRFLRGLIDEFTIYGRALSTQEIQEIVSAGCSGKCGADHRGPRHERRCGHGDQWHGGGHGRAGIQPGHQSRVRF
jgi:hypothetical protein